MINTTNATRTVQTYTQQYQSYCPRPFIEPTVNNIAELYAGLQQAESYLETHHLLHLASNGISIAVVVIQCVCIFKIYLDYGYILFRNEGASIKKRCKFILFLKSAVLLRMHSFLTTLKVYVYFSVVIFASILSVSTIGREIPVLAVLYITATLLGTLAGYYGYRDCSYYISSLHISMVLSQIIILGFMYMLVQSETTINYSWNVSLLSTKMLINTYLIGNSVWCIFDFPIRLREDSKSLKF